MSLSELITTNHLNRKAIIYIRQSTPQQVVTNQESRKYQYALRTRARELGWNENDIEVIDIDLGLTGTNASQRDGFQHMLGEVTLGHVGLILSYDATRLARNCSDWYPLLDLCGYRQCLIADRDGVYDPSVINGRLLLGLKGQLAEVELSTIRARLTAGILSKAQRGELALKLPVGYLRNEIGVVEKDPNKEVQERIDNIFRWFIEYKTASKMLRYLNQHTLKIPRDSTYNEVYWQCATISRLTTMLKNPCYAGAFVYGRTHSSRSFDGKGKISIKTLPMDQWKIVVKDKYPSYITWCTPSGSCTFARHRILW